MSKAAVSSSVWLIYVRAISAAVDACSGRGARSSCSIASEVWGPLQGDKADKPNVDRGRVAPPHRRLHSGRSEPPRDLLDKADRGEVQGRTGDAGQMGEAGRGEGGAG